MPLLVPPSSLEPLRRASRAESFRVDLLTRQDGTAGVLEGVSATGVTVDADTTIQGAGTLSLDESDTQTVDWLTARCQPWLESNGESWPLGVFLMAAPDTKYSGPLRSWDVTLSDKLTILDGDKVPETYSVAAGANVVNAVRACIEQAGETRHSITASSQTLNSAMVWTQGTSRLTIVSDLLAAINYDPLRCDGWGRFVSAPYVEPANRPIAESFVEGEDAIHLDTFTVSKDLTNVPNRIICVASGGSSGVSLTAVAENHNPDSPFSIENRGRVITRMDQVETTDPQTLNAVAARRMIEAMDPTETVVFQHAVMPLTIGQVVRFRSQGVDLTGVITRTEVSLQVGDVDASTLQTTSIRKVVKPNG